MLRVQLLEEQCDADASAQITFLLPDLLKKSLSQLRPYWFDPAAVLKCEQSRNLTTWPPFFVQCGETHVRSLVLLQGLRVHDCKIRFPTGLLP